MVIHLIILFPLFLLQACSDPPESVKEVPPETAEVLTETSPSPFQLPASAEQRIKTALVEKRLLSQAIVAPGGVALDLGKMAKVSSRLEGQVEEVFVQLGNHVKAGTPLLAIGSLKLDELVQEFLVSKVQVDLRQTNFERTKKLHAEQIVSERRLMEDQAQYFEAQAINQHVTEKLQNMGLLKKRLERTVAQPYDGGPSLHH